MISFTKIRLPYGWLSNMSPHPLSDEPWGTWRTAEHLFQAMRFQDQEAIVREIFNTVSPMGAKMAAKKYLDRASIVPGARPTSRTWPASCSSRSPSTPS